SSVGESNLGEEEDNPGGGNGGEGTAVSENAHTVLAYGLDMQVIVKGAFAQTISVYNVVGQLLETRVASSDTEIFNVYPEGVYIVNVGEETYKVVVK
ncbi:MAG: T9SS type A sorting domain-containing protein, partial [Paludibacteraceae bacterium]|nr:T9SS type A sorting domain-containing protein [Paludibacteraceae bacterium]